MRATPVVALAVVLQLIVLVPFTVASGLVAPAWAIALLALLCVLGAVTILRTARRRPLVTPLVPLVNAALLFGLIAFGEQMLGWTS
jgi:hypothetical protein